MSSDSNIIDYRGVEIHRKEHVVLKSVDFSVKPGELLFLTGKVGSGKSSLLKSVYGEVPIEDGEAEVLGYDLTKLKAKQIAPLRRKIGIVFQDFRLLGDRSVRDNLDFVLRATGWKDVNQREDQITGVLKRVGMENKGSKLPHELSGGEQQMVVIARAILNNPELILADEPTGNLDPEATVQVMKCLREISSKGTAVVVATHNMSLIGSCKARIYDCSDKGVREIKISIDN